MGGVETTDVVCLSIQPGVPANKDVVQRSADALNKVTKLLQEKDEENSVLLEEIKVLRQRASASGSEANSARELAVEAEAARVAAEARCADVEKKKQEAEAALESSHAPIAQRKSQLDAAAATLAREKDLLEKSSFQQAETTRLELLSHKQQLDQAKAAEAEAISELEASRSGMRGLQAEVDALRNSLEEMHASVVTERERSTRASQALARAHEEEKEKLERKTFALQEEIRLMGVAGAGRRAADEHVVEQATADAAKAAVDDARRAESLAKKELERVRKEALEVEMRLRADLDAAKTTAEASELSLRETAARVQKQLDEVSGAAHAERAALEAQIAAERERSEDRVRLVRLEATQLAQALHTKYENGQWEAEAAQQMVRSMMPPDEEPAAAAKNAVVVAPTAAGSSSQRPSTSPLTDGVGGKPLTTATPTGRGVPNLGSDGLAEDIGLTRHTPARHMPKYESDEEEEDSTNAAAAVETPRTVPRPSSRLAMDASDELPLRPPNPEDIAKAKEAEAAKLVTKSAKQLELEAEWEDGDL